MLIVTVPEGDPAVRDEIRERLERLGLRTRLGAGNGRSCLVCTGDPVALRQGALVDLPAGAELVLPPVPYPLSGRQAAPTTIVRLPAREPVVIGGDAVVVAAGPCAVEGREMLERTARAVRDAGAVLLRGGAFKPRTSPYAFAGLGAPALALLGEARALTGLPVVSEIMDARQLDAMMPYVDLFQVGARNMQNYTLLAELGGIRRPVLLKRGPAATVEELLLAAEHVMVRGNTQLILCERGVRARETLTRNTLDVCAVAVLKRETHLPVLVDPSHAAGRADLVTPLALSAIAAGADGLLVETHPAPADALSDGAQSLSLTQFGELMAALSPVVHALGRAMHAPGPTRREIAA